MQISFVVDIQYYEPFLRGEAVRMMPMNHAHMGLTVTAAPSEIEITITPSSREGAALVRLVSPAIVPVVGLVGK